MTCESELKMVERGWNWTDKEISALLAIRSEGRVQRQLLGAIRNASVFTTISNTMQEHGHIQDPKQCHEKSKALEKKYKESADSLLRIGIGIVLDNNFEDPQNIFWLQMV